MFYWRAVVIEQILKKTRRINGRPSHLATGKIIRGKGRLALITKALCGQRETFAKQISSFYLIAIAPLVIIDGKFTALGLKTGYYQGELNPLINYLFGYLEVDTVFWLRAILVILAVMFLIFAYLKYPGYVKKYYLLLALTVISYLAINIAHIWVLIAAVI